MWVPNSRDYRGDYRSLTQKEKIGIFLGTTLVMPGVAVLRGPAAINSFWKGWKLRQATLAYGLLSDSTGGGGPSEPLTSTESPPSLEQIGKASEHISSPAAAGNSAQGGRRSGSKPRKKCPFGHYWSKKHRRCLPRKDKWFFEWR